MDSVGVVTKGHHRTVGNGTTTTITLSATRDATSSPILVTESVDIPHSSTTTVLLDGVPIVTQETLPVDTVTVTKQDTTTKIKDHTTTVEKDPAIVTKFVTALTVVKLEDARTMSLGTPLSTPTLPPLSSGAFAKLVELGTTSFTMTQRTQTVGNKVYVTDPLNKYRMYDPYDHAVAPTDACDKGKGFAKDISGGNCRIDECMWDFMKPMNISTAMPAMFYNGNGLHTINYITHVTELRYPHWGTSTTDGVYYPTSDEYPIIAGTPTHSVLRATPSGDLDDQLTIHGNPVCHDMESCHSYCTNHSKSFPWMSNKHLKFLLFPLLAAIILLLLLILCCGCLKKRKREGKESPIDKIRRRSSTNKPEVVVVNQVTGTAQDPSTGQPSDPSQASAILTGSAAGAEAGREKQEQTTGDDGKGTMGRRAEEGRGRVNFEDGGRPGNEQPSPPQEKVEVVRQDPPPPQAETRTETVETRQEAGPKPPGQTDGTSELSTGYTPFDTGSMRGRKRARPEGEGRGLNLGF